MATVILLFLPPFPFSALFLSPRERAIAQARLDRDHKPQSHGGMTGWQGFRAIIADPNAWLFMTVYASCECLLILPWMDSSLILHLPVNVGVATVSYFLPTVRSPLYWQRSWFLHLIVQLIKDLGFSSINAQGLTVAPYVVGWFMVIFQSWHSDYTKDRGYHIMFSASLSAIGYIILAAVAHKSIGAAYFALFLVVGGNYSLFPLVMQVTLWIPALQNDWLTGPILRSWAANTFSPTSKRGVGTAFVVSISNCVSMWVCGLRGLLRWIMIDSCSANAAPPLKYILTQKTHSVKDTRFLRGKKSLRIFLSSHWHSWS